MRKWTFVKHVSGPESALLHLWSHLILIQKIKPLRTGYYYLPVSERNWRRQWRPTPVLLPRKSHGRRSLVGCGPWGRYKLDTTEWLHFHFSLSCIGEGHGNPLLCSCLENPRDGEAWWSAVYGVAQGRTRLKPLISSSSREEHRLLVVG